MAHLGRRRDRLIIGRERIARAADDRYGLERHLPDLRIVGRKRVAKGKVRRAVPRVDRHGLRQRAELLEAAGHAAEQLDLDGLGVPLAVDAHDNAPGLTRACRIRRRELRDDDVMRADVRGLRRYSQATVEGRGRELNGVVPICRIAVRRIATGTVAPSPKVPACGAKAMPAGSEGRTANW